MADFNLSDFKPKDYARYQSVSGNFSAKNLDYLIVTNGNCTITLPSSPTLGMKVTISADITNTLDYVNNKINIVVATPSTETIEGFTDDFVIDVNDTTTTFTCSATNSWRIS